MLERMAWTWLLLSFAGLTLYVGFYAALESEDFWSHGQKLCMMAKTEGPGKRDIKRLQEIEDMCTAKGLVILYVIKGMFIDKVFAILAVASFALTISILLVLDDQPRSEEQLENMTFAGLGYVLLVKRKPLVAVLVLTLVTIGLAVYYLSKSMGVTLEIEGNALTIKLPGQTIHYIPIHSQLGWQNTGIELKAGQKVQYSIAGAVSPGYLQDIHIRSAQLRGYKLGQHEFDESPDPKWPFTGPEGYKSDLYYDMEKQDQKDCDRKPQDRVEELEAMIQQMREQLDQISRTLSRPPSSEPFEELRKAKEEFARKNKEEVTKRCIDRKTKHETLSIFISQHHAMVCTVGES